jgi:hypothetical protein
MSTEQPKQTVSIPTVNERAPGTLAALLTFYQCGDGLSIDLAIEGGGDAEIDPRDPGHVLALFVQHNALVLLPQAVLWVSEVARQHRDSALAKAVQRSTEQDVVEPGERTVVDASGVPFEQAGASAGTSAGDFLSKAPDEAVRIIDSDPSYAERAQLAKLLPGDASQGG